MIGRRHVTLVIRLGALRHDRFLRNRRVGRGGDPGAGPALSGPRRGTANRVAGAGGPEDTWTGQARTAFDDALAYAAALGVTVTAAAGDDGSTDRAADGRSHVDFPTSSPHALACGGTRLDADARTGAVTSEVVWNNGAYRAGPGWDACTGLGVPVGTASAAALT